MPDTKLAGDTAEAIVMAEFVKLGFPVAVPWGDNRRYDLLVEVGGRFLRIQVKVASLCGYNGSKECLRFHSSSSRYSAGRFQGREDYRGAADIFGVYSPDTGAVYVLPIDDSLPVTDVWLRLRPTSANNQHGIRLASECTISAWAARQG